MRVIEISFSAAVLIAIIVVIRAVAIHKLPKWTFMALWGIVLCQLLLPFSIPSQLSVYNALQPAGALLGIVQVQPQDKAEMENRGLADGLSQWDVSTTTAAASPVGNSSFNTAAIQPTSELQDSSFLSFFSTWPTLVLIWLVGCSLMALFFIVTHLRWRRTYSASLPVESGFPQQWLEQQQTRRKIQLRQSDQVTSPLTYGIWRPVILLPKMTVNTATDNMLFILTHEFIHIKRLDTLKKWLLAASLCVHWFNPLVWVMYFLANRDIELSCDEAVVQTLGTVKKSDYALALIGMEEKRRLFAPLCNNFSKNAIEERITAIMKSKRIKGSLLFSFALVIGLMIAFGTSAVESKSKAPSTLEDALKSIFHIDTRPYEEHINVVATPSARVIQDDFTLYIDSTLYTDHQVYALIGATGSLPAELELDGRVLFSHTNQPIYGLSGSTINEIKTDDQQTRYFLYHASIAEPPAPLADTKVVLAAGDQFLKQSSLRDYEGNKLEITADLLGKKHVLEAPISKVYTQALRFHPASIGDQSIDAVILTPYELKLSGRTDKDYPNYAEWDKQFHFKIEIVLHDGNTIAMSYDSRGTISDEYYPLAMSRGQDNDSFYHYWNFREWELDVTLVDAIIMNGIVYKPVH